MKRREYRKDTFKAFQEKKVSERVQDIREALGFLAKSNLKFKNMSQLAEHVSELLTKEGKPADASTLVRRYNFKGGVKVPNHYRIELQKYQMGKYFGKGKAQAITAQDVEDLRMQYPAVDAYCAGKELDVKDLEEQVKLQKWEIKRLQEGRAQLPQEISTNGELSRQLDKTCTALMRMLDATKDFFEIDWQRRAIVDTSCKPSKVVVELDLLGAFFRALENAGIRPPEGN